MSTPKYENLDKFSLNILVNIKLRYRISRASNTMPKQLRCFAVERLNDGNVATMYHHELEAEQSDASEAEPLSLDDKWKQMEETVGKVAINTNKNRHRQHTKTSEKGVVRREMRKGEQREERLYSECHPKTASNKYRQARSLDEKASIEIERHRSYQDSRKFYKRLNNMKRHMWPFLGPRTVNY
jgi:hypothetical protein